MFSLNKDFVINNHTEFPLYFYNAAGATITTPLSATKMIIAGVGEFTAADVAEVNAYKATTAQNQVLDLDASDVATIAVAQGTTAANTAVAIDTIVNLVFNIFSDNNEVQDGRDRLSPGREKVYNILVKPSYGASEANAADAATAIAGEILLQLHNLIAQESVLSEVPFTSAIIYDAGSPTSAKVARASITDIKTVEIALTMNNEHKFLKTAEALDEQGDSSSLVTVFAPAITTERLGGRGTSTLIRENVRLLTDVSTRPYGDLNHELAVNGAEYSQIAFSYTRTRNEQNLGSPAIAGNTNLVSKSKFVLYLLQDGHADTTNGNINGLEGDNNYIHDILDFLSVSNAAMDLYKSQSAAGAEVRQDDTSGDVVGDGGYDQEEAIDRFSQGV